MNIRTFFTVFAFSCACFSFGKTECQQTLPDPGKVHLSEVGKGYAATSVNTAVFRANSVTSKDSIQYVCYYDPEGFVTVGRRILGSDNWTVARTPFKGNVTDGHNVISMAVDGDGYLHLSFDHHGHPLKYVRSIAPDSLVFGDTEPMTGVDENDVTYPEFHTLPSGDLLFIYRSGASGRGNMVMNRYDVKNRKWNRVHDILIDGEDQRNAYWQMCTDSQGTIHLSWVWRETWLVETNHDLCYARSRDGGKTWERSDGTPYTLPITIKDAETAWKIPQNSELINQTSMATDKAGNPMIATYWRDKDSDVPQFRLVSHKNGEWKMETVGERHTPFSLSGGGTKMIPISRPRLVSDGETFHYIFRDEERGSKVTVASKKEGEKEWKLNDLTEFSVDAWEPSLDNDLWKNCGKLHIYVQKTSQGDGEKVTQTPPQPVYILEIK